MKKLQTTLFMALLTAGLFSCKKDKTKDPQPVLTINPAETATTETNKVLQYNFAGNVNDVSGNSLNAIAYSTPFTTDRFGRNNQAAHFNGPTTGISLPSLFDQQINYPFSVSIWFNANQTDSLQTILLADGKSGYNNYTGFSLQLGGPGRSKALAFSTGNEVCACPSARQTSYIENVLNPNTWYHVVVNVRADGFDGRDIYINGVKQNNLVPEGVNSIPTIAWLDPALNSGAGGLLGFNYNPQYNYQLFGGKIDDLRIYKKILTADDVAALYNWRP